MDGGRSDYRDGGWVIITGGEANGTEDGLVNGSQHDDGGSVNITGGYAQVTKTQRDTVRIQREYSEMQ